MQEENKPVYDFDLESIKEDIRDHGYPRCSGYLYDNSDEDEKEEG